MERRKLLVGLGSVILGGGAVLGFEAFSQVESARDLRVQVATDAEAYLGLSGTGSPNSDSYVEVDGAGHLAIDIGENLAGGEGHNSDSFTWFDGMIEVCNQGKEAVGFYVREPTDEDFPDGIDAEYQGEPRLQLYTGEAAGEGNAGTDSVMGERNAEEITLGECRELGLRTTTTGVDASADGPGQLFDDDVTLVASVDVEETPDGPPIRNTRTDETYTSLQAAVDDADAGDTLLVREGATFEEDVLIDIKNLTIEATDNTKPRVTGTMSIQASGVTVVDLAIMMPADEEVGIEIPGSGDGATIHRCTVAGDGIGVAAGASGVAVIDSVVTGYNVGVFAGGDAEVSVRDSTVEGGSETDGIPPVGVYYDGATGEIQNNDVGDNQAAESTEFAGVGIVAQGTAGLAIAENTVTGNDVGVEVRGAGLDRLVDPAATRTDVGGPDQDAAPDATNTRIEGNEISANGYTGVQLHNGAVDTIVTENLLRDNDAAGIGIDDRVFGGDPPTGFDARRNDLVENGRYGIQNVVDEAIDATGCWWGDEDGPGAASTNSTFGAVTAEPWSTEPGPDWNRGGAQ